ncbi:alpha/beta hydrolase [Nocardia uniformis]|uniref:Alpha/beta hydrolase n=1 Tax=Nocardia uniformis TaxID=53432 RepID=A0A849C7G4_9NOCA|nr:alpha/beta hydrolase [Nocardia uniformis]NNH73688.1 alpha/beta hydrolase [Nocardia uniformis]
MDGELDNRYDRPDAPARSTLWLDGRRLSYIDYGGPGHPLLALHGHLGEGRTFTRLAKVLTPRWRLVAPDQRGHGESDSVGDYSRDGYLRDTVALLDHLGFDRLPVIGHSLGGVNAYQLAAAQPDRVSALVIEDIGAVVDSDLSFTLDWPNRAVNREALSTALGRLAPHLVDAFRQYTDGWGLAFNPAHMVESQRCLNGDHWADWLASDCPTLLLRGTRSHTLSSYHAAAMASRRARTRLVEVSAGHVIHDDQPEMFAAIVRDFLDQASDVGSRCGTSVAQGDPSQPVDQTGVGPIIARPGQRPVHGGWFLPNGSGQLSSIVCECEPLPLTRPVHQTATHGEKSKAT